MTRFDSPTSPVQCGKVLTFFILFNPSLSDVRGRRQLETLITTERSHRAREASGVAWLQLYIHTSHLSAHTQGKIGDNTGSVYRLVVLSLYVHSIHIMFIVCILNTVNQDCKTSRKECWRIWWLAITIDSLWDEVTLQSPRKLWWDFTEAVAERTHHICQWWEPISQTPTTLSPWKKLLYQCLG